MEKIIMHIDFDSYFASCEQQFNPDFRGKAIGVTAEHGRTCIIAASREAKKFGIKTGSRSYEAQKIIPDIILVPASFDKYYAVTKKFLKICSFYSPAVELFSIDEAFIDLTPVMHLYPSIEFVASGIKKRINKDIGEFITVSIGVSHNRLLAKLASSINKPNGFATIKKEDVDGIYSKIKLTDICGIGEALRLRLNIIGVFNFFDLRTCPINLLKAEFGKVTAYHLKSISLGIDNMPVIPYYIEKDSKSVGRNYCLPKNEYNQTKILKIIYELCEEIAKKLRKIDKKAKTIGLCLAGGKSKCERKTIGKYTDLGQEIFYTCKYLYNQWQWNSMVRRISVWAGNLTHSGYASFDFYNDEKKEKIAEVIDSINEKFRDHTIRNGFLIYTDKLTTKPNGYLSEKHMPLLI